VVPSRPVAQPTADLTSAPASTWRERLLLGPFFAVVAAVMALPAPWQWSTRIAGDNGDAVFNLWVMNWVGKHLFSWSTLWRGQVFQPNDLVLAYSDIVLPQSLVFRLFDTVVSDAAAFNLTSWVAWILSLWLCFALLRRITGSVAGALVATVAWNFAACRLGHVWHFQLVTAGFVIPLCLLAYFRLIERPSIVRGVMLGLSLAISVLAASYYGAMMAVGIAVISIVEIAGNRRLLTRSLLLALLAGAAVAGVLLGPVYLQYERLGRDPHFERTAEPAFSTTARDLLVPASTTRVLDDVPVLEDLEARNVERQAFTGALLSTAAVVGLVVLVRRRRISREVLGLVVLGAVMLLLSGGSRGWLVGIDAPAPFALLRTIVPPLSGIRAVSRFVVLFQLAVAVLGAIGVGAALAHVRGRAWRAAAVAAAVLLVLVETAIHVPTVRLPEKAEWTAVNRALRDAPDGLVVELPIVGSAGGVAWPYVEAPRQYLATIDGHPRVNGYSGFEPPRFPELTDALNRFPDDDAIAVMRDLGVRYVVVRPSMVGHFAPEVRSLLRTLLPSFDTDAAIGETRFAPERIGDAWLFDLTAP
jgi:hypothetical protein